VLFAERAAMIRASALLVLLSGFAVADEGKEADAARAMAKLMGFSKAELARAGDSSAWSFASFELPSHERILAASTAKLVDPPKGADPSVKTPRVKVALVRGEKALFSFAAAGAKDFHWKEEMPCDNGASVAIAPVDLGGKQHVRINVGCIAGEDCIMGGSTVFLFRIEVDAAGAPSGLALAWVGPGDNNHPEGNCVEGGCDYTETVGFAISGDGKTLMVQNSNHVDFVGGEENAAAKKACHAHGPRTTSESATYSLADGGMKTFAGAAPEAPILDEATPPAKAAQLARDATKLPDAGARHNFAVAANSRGHRLFQAGKCPDALPLFEAAAALDGKYGMPRYNAARCYALSGDAAGCTRALTELKALGKAQKNRLTEAKKDEAFKKVWDDPAFQQLFR
jgi:hypothetical protein